MEWVLAVLVLAGLGVALGGRRAHYALIERGERLAARIYARALWRRRTRTLAWINEWRIEHGRTQLEELRKGIRGSRRYGVIARNMGVLSYADGVWTDVSGRGGEVPDYVAQFARDFDDGLFADLCGQLARVSVHTLVADPAQDPAFAECAALA